MIDFLLFLEEQTYIFRKPHYTADIKKRKPLKHYLKLIAFFLVVIGVFAFALYKSINVTYIICNNEHDTVIGFSTNIEKIVEKSSFTLKPEDSLVLDYFSEDETVHTIFIAREQSVMIYENGKLVSTTDVSGTVKQALESSGITLTKHDKVTPGLATIVTNGMNINISKAFQVTVVADGKKEKLYCSGDTVENFLRENGYILNEHDEVTPALSDTISKKTKITIKRVEVKEKSRTVALKYSTVTEYSSDMYTDQSKVKTKGKDGKVKEYYTEKYVDGKLTETIITKRKVIKEKTDKVIIKGTKSRPLNTVNGKRVFSELTPPFKIELDSANRPKNYIKMIRGTATAYCGGGTTSTGAKAMPGRVAVNPRQIPYGTKMYIVSTDGRYCYGYSVASDTGGFARQGSATVDLYMHSYNDCIQFGRRSVDIYILEW